MNSDTEVKVYNVTLNTPTMVRAEEEIILAMQKLGPEGTWFSSRELEAETGMNKIRIKSYIQTLKSKGFIKSKGKTLARRHKYTTLGIEIACNGVEKPETRHKGRKPSLRSKSSPPRVTPSVSPAAFPDAVERCIKALVEYEEAHAKLKHEVETLCINATGWHKALVQRATIIEEALGQK